jgi:hypothetical protein
MVSHLTSVNPFFQDVHKLNGKDRRLPGEADTDHIQGGFRAEYQPLWVILTINRLRKGQASTPPPIHACLNLDDVVVVEWPPVFAGSFYKGEV